MSKKFVYVSVTLLVILVVGATVPVDVYTYRNKAFDVCGAGDPREQPTHVRLDLIKDETLSAIRNADTEPRYIVGCSGAAIYKLYLF